MFFSFVFSKPSFYMGFGGDFRGVHQWIYIVVGSLVLPGCLRSIPDHLAINDTAHAVKQLDRELGKYMSITETCFGMVCEGCSLYNVPNNKVLNGLVIGYTLAALFWYDRCFLFLFFV